MNNIQLSLVISASGLLIIICLGLLYKKKNNNNKLRDMIYLPHDIRPYLNSYDGRIIDLEEGNYHEELSDTDTNKIYTIDDVSCIVDEKSHISDKSFISDINEKSFISDKSDATDYINSKSITMTQLRSLSKEENEWLQNYIQKNNNDSFVYI